MILKRASLLFGIASLGLLCAQAPQAPNPTQQSVQGGPGLPVPIFRVTVVARTTKAINYHHRSGPTMIDFKGTELMPEAKGQARVESKQGVIKIDASTEKMRPPQSYGPEYLTYVLWAVTPEGRATNVGEVLLNGGRSKLDATTELQSFGLIVTAEPYFAVTQPSDVVVMENFVRRDTTGTIEDLDAKFELLKRGQYTLNASRTDLSKPWVDPKTPIELQEARNAVQIARWAGAERYAWDTYQKAVIGLQNAEGYLQGKAGKKPIGTVAREAVQMAEDARIITIKKLEEQELAAERAAAADREARAKADANEQARLAALETQRRTQAEADRAAAADREARAKADANEQARLAALETQRRTQAEADRAAATEREARAKLEAEATARQAQFESQRRAQAESERIAAENAKAAAEAAKRESEQARQEALAAADQATKLKAEADVARAAAIADQQAAQAEAAKARSAADEADRQRRSAENSRDAAEHSREAAERDKEQLRAQLLQQLNLVLETRNSARGLIVNMSDVLFDFNQYTLKPGAREKLAKISGIVLAHPGLRLEVEGHTDSVGGDAYNQKLSEQRAASTRDYLVQQGVASNSVTSRGFGKTRPVATNDTAEGRQRNRRVELVVSGDIIGAPISSTLSINSNSR